MLAPGELGARDPATWLLVTRGALRRLREIGRPALPVLREVLRQGFTGTVQERLSTLVREIEGDAGG